MSITKQWTRQSQTRSTYQRATGKLSGPWSEIRSEHLRLVGEPLAWEFDWGERADVNQMEPWIRASVLGPIDETWRPPRWLKAHQVDAARRIRASINQYRGALLADAVGLGKTYVALAVATTFGSTAVAVPAALLSQWKRVTKRLNIEADFVTHEGLSRGQRIRRCDLVVVDEAHRFRNPKTRRYDSLSRSVVNSRLLLITATPVVNGAKDLIHLLRLFAADHTFVLHGVASLEQCVEQRRHTTLALGTSPSVVARPVHVIEGIADALPRIVGRGIFRLEPVPSDALTPLIGQIAALRFPATGGVVAASDLLRLHMLYRLASSTAACRESILRHLTYVDRASRAAQRGEVLPRQQARRLFGPDDEMQLDFSELWENGTTPPLDVTALREERLRLCKLLATLRELDTMPPKTAGLIRLLERGGVSKSIIFTTAVATACDLARHLKWRQLAVVTAGHARIASGRIGLDEAFALFAPKSRGAAEPPAFKRLHTLIATDMASEGLDLQDADQIIHFDLPWTPMRLEQRVGRIVRLGSEHATAAVCWFTPPAAIERHLQLETRIATKAHTQLGLHVTSTARVGRARVVNEFLERRERFGNASVRAQPTRAYFSVVHGPLAATFAVRWKTETLDAPELMTFAGSPPVFIDDFAAIEEIVASLLAAEPVRATPNAQLVDVFVATVRNRLAAADRGPVNTANRRLTRVLLSHAVVAGRDRRIKQLRMLDAALDRLRSGVSVGAERNLEDALRNWTQEAPLATWLEEQSQSSNSPASIRVVAALFGDGRSKVSNMISMT